MTWDSHSVAEMAQEFRDREAKIAELRAEQVVLVHEAERAQAPRCDGSRSMVEWVQSQGDVSDEVARNLVFAGRGIAHHRYLALKLAWGNARLTVRSSL